MSNRHTTGFDPAVLKQLYVAFDSAWDAVRESATDRNREGAREAVGKAIFGLAKTGYCNPEHLAKYGAYQGRLFIDLRGNTRKAGSVMVDSN